MIWTKSSSSDPFSKGPIVRRLAGQLQAADLEIARSNANQTLAHADSGELASFLEADRAFHLHLLSCSGNTRLAAIVGTLRDQTRLYGLTDLARSGSLIESANEHVLLVQAIETGKAQQAETIMHRHLRHTRGIWAGKPEETK